MFVADGYGLLLFLRHELPHHFMITLFLGKLSYGARRLWYQISCAAQIQGILGIFLVRTIVSMQFVV